MGRHLIILVCLYLMACEAPPGTPPTLVPFEDSLSDDVLWGYKRPDGTVAIPPRYVVAEPFTPQGLAAVADSTGWQYIDATGAVVIRPFVVDSAPDAFREGIARFVEDGRFGYFDATGTVVIPARFDFAAPFDENRAAFCEGCDPRQHGEHTFYAGGRWGYLDRTGAVAISARFDAAQPFDDGTARVQVDGRWRRIDTTGTFVD